MKIGFIGCGNMGGAIACAVAKVEGAEIFVSSFDKTAAEAISKKIDCVKISNETIARSCDFVFLGVKPNVVSAVAEEISIALMQNTDAIVVSMAAGVSTESLSGMLPNGTKIIRIMPNTPVMLGLGVTTWCHNGKISEDEAQTFEKIMAYSGTVDRIDEALIDAATAVAGCGPAFAYMFCDALAKGGETCGLSYDKALLYAAKMLEGAAAMITEAGKAPDVLIDNVCSPGGSTIEGVNSLRADDLYSTVARAVNKSYEKTKLLGKK